MMHAVTSYDPDMKDALVDLFQDIVGAGVEQKKILVHQAREKMKKILYSQLQKCVNEEKLNNLDTESQL